MSIRAIRGLFLLSALLSGCAVSSPDPRFAVGTLLLTDDFQTDSGQWKSELENGGRITIGQGVLDINVPAGATIWFAKPLNGPVMIQYKATAVSAGGANDRVSDLNCFWMARDSRNPTDLFAVHRNGSFADCNPLLTYYASIGGNGNTTTRFRRYIGSATTRPLRPQDDLRNQPLIANQEQTITLIAAGKTIEFYRDGRRLFEMEDEHPYRSGWFAFRTVDSHLHIRDFRVYSLRWRARISGLGEPES